MMQSMTTHNDLMLSNGGIEIAKHVLIALSVQRRTQKQYDELHGFRSDTEAIGALHCERVEGIWKAQGRQVLAMNPELTGELQMATSTKIEPEVFRHLPYRDPLVVFPGGVEVPSWRGEESHRVLGFFTGGRSGEGMAVGGWKTRADMESEFDRVVRTTSTHDPDIERFGVIIVNEVTDYRAGVPVFEFNRISFPLDRGHSLEDHVERMIYDYGWSHAEINGSPTSIERRADYMRAQLGLVMGSLMYLASTVLDVQPVPKSRVARAWRGADSKPPTMINVGWTIGPALSKARRAAEESASSGGTGTGQRPHQRCAHFKTVWTGKGRTIPKTVLIAPYWVHRDRLGLTETKTVRAVS